jgi:hypothetical protein
MPSELTKAAQKILKRWALDDYYIYMRPMSSLYMDRTRKATVYWSVSVEFRHYGNGPTQYRGEGYDLSEIIVELASRVPDRKDVQPNYKAGPTGWLAPERAKDVTKVARVVVVTKEHARIMKDFSAAIRRLESRARH